VLYGMFRLYGLAVGPVAAGPVELVRKDRVMWLVALAWVAAVLGVMHTRNWPAMQGWLVP